MIHLIPQGTDEWLQLRLGKATASRISDIVARTKSGWGASRANYAAQLVAERLTGAPQESFTNAAMAWGTATEPKARAAYAFRYDVDVEEVGFVDHPNIIMAGCSPDGLVGTEGMVEFKCPNTATHIATLLNKSFAEKYVFQAHWQMSCCPNRNWVDLASYDPRLPESMRLFVKRLHRDEEAIAKLEADVAAFLEEVEQTVASLREIYEPEALAA